MFCSISGKLAELPVICSKTGLIYEQRLIEKSIDVDDDIMGTGKCPVTGTEISKEDLIVVKLSSLDNENSDNIARNIKNTSIPGLLGTLQNEWDALMLETCTLKRHLYDTRKELAHALYQHDAACRVIARLLKEKEETKQQLILMESQVLNNKTNSNNELDNQKDNDTNESINFVPQLVIDNIETKAKQLSQYRRKERKVNTDILDKIDINKFHTIGSHNIHKSDRPGVLCLDIHPSMDHIMVTGGNDRQIKIFNSQSKKTINTITGHNKKITQVAFHQTADLLFSSSADKTVKLWNFKHDNDNAKEIFETELTHSLAGHEDSITDFSIHPTGEYIITTSLDGGWNFYDICTGKMFEKIMPEDDKIDKNLCIKFHPDGAIFGIGKKEKKAIEIWDIKTRENMAIFEGHEDKVNSISFSENGYHMISGSDDKKIKFWDLRKLKVFHEINFEELIGETATVQYVQFEYNGTYVAAGVGDNVCIMNEVSKRKWEVVRTFDDHTGTVTNVKFGKNINYIASTSLDRSVKIFGLE